ncbi:MAG: hypothetical protein KIT31_23680, partial [Deltaproteobacteria bacterium]|nr:hypothetical protein [Deltaproteobacteria bacterium]
MREGWPRILVVRNEDLLCLVDRHVVSVISLPDLAPMGEVGLEEGSDARLLGDPPRLLVISPAGLLHVVALDRSDGPVELAQVKLAAGSTFLAVSGLYALVASPSGVVVVSITDPPAVHAFPTRGHLPELASASSPDHFLVQTGGVLEEWSGVTRAPLRRYRLDRAMSAAQIGCADRFAWFIQRDTPAQMVALPLGGNLPPVRIELPEPAALAVGDSGGPRVAIIGAHTGSLFVSSLVTRTVVAISRTLTHDVGWLDASDLVRLTDTILDIVQIPSLTNGKSDHATPRVRRITRPMPVDDPESAAPPAPAISTPEIQVPPPSVPPGDDPPPGLGVTPLPALPRPPAAPRMVPEEAWRDAIATWARASMRGLRGEPPGIR